MKTDTKDRYLNKIIDYSMKKFSDELAAIVIYGSFVSGYYDKKKSDYDLIFLFKNKLPQGKEELASVFPRASIQYFMTLGEAEKRIGINHWWSYLVIVKTGKVLYSTKEYEKFVNKALKVNLSESEFDLDDFKKKIKGKKEMFTKEGGFKAIKFSFANIRNLLSMRGYITNKKLLWNIGELVRDNNDILEENDREFLFYLNDKLMKRSEDFSVVDMEMACEIFDKVVKDIESELKNNHPRYLTFPGRGS